MQGFFPLFFVLLFLSSMYLPRPLIEQDWFRTIATYNPVSYLIEGIRSHRLRWDGEAIALGFGVALAMAALGVFGAAAACGRGWCGHEAARAGRARRRVAVAPQHPHQPGVPAAVADLPAVLLHRVRGRAVGVGKVPGFDFPSGYTAFQFVFVLLQASAFGGVFTGFGIAADFEYGFAALLLARRTGSRSSPATRWSG